MPASEARGSEGEVLTAETVESVDESRFLDYTGRINTYLQVLVLNTNSYT